MKRSALLSSDQTRRRTIVTGVTAVFLGVLGWVAPAGGATTLFQMLLPAEAAILGIVVSVTFLSLQISSNQYAPLVSRLYRDDAFTGIIERFGLAILMDVIFIVTTPMIALSPITRGLAVAIVSGLATRSFLSIFAIESQLEVFLNPEPVLDDLLEDVSLDRYRRFTETRREEGRITRNPLLEIYQIATTSLETHDNYGAIRAIDALGEATQRIFLAYEGAGESDHEDLAEPIHKVFTYWDDLALAATTTGADDVLHAIVDTEVEVTKTLLDRNDKQLAVEAVRSVIYYYEVVIDTGTPHRASKLETLLESAIETDHPAVVREVAQGIVRLNDTLSVHFGPFRGDRRAFAVELFQCVLLGWIDYRRSELADEAAQLIDLERALVGLAKSWVVTDSPETAHILRILLARADNLSAGTTQYRLWRLAITIGRESGNMPLVSEQLSSRACGAEICPPENPLESPIDDWFVTVLRETDREECLPVE